MQVNNKLFRHNAKVQSNSYLAVKSWIKKTYFRPSTEEHTPNANMHPGNKIFIDKLSYWRSTENEWMLAAVSVQLQSKCYAKLSFLMTLAMGNWGHSGHKV